MANNRQPLEGLTVRIWDPPAPSINNDKNTKNSQGGSRGFRQYTEQVGSDKLKYTTHDWDDKMKKTDTTKYTTNTDGLKKSARNWDAERREAVQDLPLVSRSNPSDNQSLKIVRLQHELWLHIIEKIVLIENSQDKIQWEPIVALFRKLREGVYASHWSDGNYQFAIKVFQESVNTSIKARDYGELIKSLSGLNDLYKIKKDAENPYYTAIDLLYHLCYIQSPKLALNCMTRLNTNTNEGIWAKKLSKCILVSQDPIQYFKLYKNNPFASFRILMDNYNDEMRIKAIDVLRKAYFSASMEWIAKWIGVEKEHVVAELNRLVKPTCIKSIDMQRQTVHFLKKSKKV